MNGLPASAKIVAFVGTTNIAEAKKFYTGQLGLPVLSEDGFALALDVHGIMLRVTIVQKVFAAPYTVLGWEVSDIAAAVEALQKSAVVLERFPGIEQDALGIWTAPGNSARVVWFKDPDGNVLSVSQHFHL